MTSSPNRRAFLWSAAATATAPFILPSRVWSAETNPSDVIRVGFIGMGKQSGILLPGFLHNGSLRVVAVCDVDTNRREHAKQRIDTFYSKHKEQSPGSCVATGNFEEIIGRDDIDAVCIATPDHWHAIITVAALNAGKDVYCEKPLTHNVHEAIAVMQATQKNGRILQTGSMQRSMKEFRVACELVRNGHIGMVDKVVCNFGAPGIPCDLPGEEVEQGLDWDRWLGPAPSRAYNAILSPRGVHQHYPGWRKYREFGGGLVTDWGAHHLDIAQWGLGMDHSGPVAVLPPDDWTPIWRKKGASYIYADGTVVKHGEGIGVHFFGSEGEIEVARGKFAFRRGGKTLAKFFSREDRVSLASQLIKAEKEFIGKEPEVSLYRSEDHIRDFVGAMKSRKNPITDAVIGGRTAVCCHLMNAAYYHGESFQWDPAGFAFAGSTGDPKWLTRDYRGDWKV